MENTFFRQNTDKFHRELMLLIEKFSKDSDNTSETKVMENSIGALSFSEENKREKVLEDAIQETIIKLDETRKSFKSKKIKEVRERLINVLNE